MANEDAVVLPGVIAKLREWHEAGHQIILTTARPESLRRRTREQLESVGIKYDRLIMDITAGERWLINDTKPHMSITARAFTIERNKGLEDFSPPE